MKHSDFLIAAVLAMMAASNSVRASLIEFDEARPLPANLTTLAGSNAFAFEGLTFGGQTEFVADQHFVGAGSDPYGIATGVSSGPGIPMGIVMFATPLTTLSISALSVNTDFIAEVYNGNNLLNTFTGTGSAGTTYFNHTFAGPITKLVFHDHGGYVGVGQLKFITAAPVATPEPEAMLLFPAFGLLLRQASPLTRKIQDSPQRVAEDRTAQLLSV